MNLLILFFYIYPIIFIGLPLSTRILYALGGVFLFICQRFIDKRLFSVWWGLVPVALCSVGSGILNLTFDFTFVIRFFKVFCLCGGDSVIIGFIDVFVPCTSRFHVFHYPVKRVGG